MTLTGAKSFTENEKPLSPPLKRTKAIRKTKADLKCSSPSQQSRRKQIQRKKKQTCAEEQ
jgi:hypothetical protein